MRCHDENEGALILVVPKLDTSPCLAVLQYNTGHLFRGRNQKKTSTQKLSGEQQPYSQSSAVLSWRSKLANGGVLLLLIFLHRCST